VLFNQDPWACRWPLAAAVAQTLLNERASEGADPFSRRDGWRSHGVVQRRFEFDLARTCQGQLTYEHDGSLPDGGRGRCRRGRPAGVQPVEGGASNCVCRPAHPRRRVWQGEVDHVFTPLGATQITAIDLLAHAGRGRAEGGRLTAPMPGKVVSFAVKAGDAVTKGQPLAVMEAMKMEHTIAAPADGVVPSCCTRPATR
jgi:3-methylcrotonyl-CoA carboxylase alpha subunit